MESAPVPPPASTRLAVILAAALLVGSVVGWNYGVAFRGDVLGFFRIGDTRPHSPFIAPSNEILAKGEVGYDGQMYLTIALDPWLRHPGSRASLDNPRFRYRRILFPLLGHLLGVGQPRLIPYALVALNAACMVGLVAVATSLRRGTNESQWNDLFTLVSPGHWCALLLTTADLLAALFLLLSLVSFERRRYGRTALWYAAAALTHETMLVVIGALALPLLAARRWRDAALLLSGALPALAWNVFVLVHLPARGSSLGFAESFGTPVAGILMKLQAVFIGALSPKTIFDAIAFLLLCASCLLLPASAIACRQLPSTVVCALAYAAFFAFSKMHILGYYLDYLRVFANVVLLLALSREWIPWRTAVTTMLAAWAALSAALVGAFSLRMI